MSVLGLTLALALACFVVELRRRRFRWLVAYAALVALQPGWDLVMQELHGGGIGVRADCGYSQRALSLFLLAATIVVSVIVWRRPTVRRRTFVFGLAAAFTSMNLLAELLFYSSNLRSAILYELYASIFSGFGGPPWLLAILIVVCAFLYVVHRIRPRTAV